jgi:hypothetical protein
MKTLLETYRHRLKTVTEEISKGGNDIQLTRLGTKAQMYREFITDIQKEFKDIEWDSAWDEMVAMSDAEKQGFMKAMMWCKKQFK